MPALTPALSRKRERGNFDGFPCTKKMNLYEKS